MKLLEFFYFNDQTNEYTDDKRYDNSRDSEVLDRSDTRKIRLTLKQINMLRMQSEAHEFERESEISFIKHMYGLPPPEPVA
jgi:hypothetical protein